MADTTDLTEAQDEFVTAQHELFQLAAHGQYTHAPLHDRTTGKYLSAQEIEAGQRAYNELIRKAQERVQAATIRAAADWLRTEYPGPDLDRHIRCAAAALDRHAAEQAPDFAHARQVLGTTTGQPETEAPAVDRATVLNERANFFESVLRNAADPGADPRYWSAISDVIRGLRQQAAEAQQPETVLDGLEPIQLRWGLDDVMHGDDDTTTILLSGPDGQPYWLELDPERAAALRDCLADPTAAAQQPTPDVTEETKPVVRMCPAKNGKWGRICDQPDGHTGFHSGPIPNGGVTWEGDAP